MLTDDSPCPVSGKQCGVLMKDVPAEFLDWLAGQPWLEKKYPDVAEYVKRNRAAIDQDIKRRGLI